MCFFFLFYFFLNVDVAIVVAILNKLTTGYRFSYYNHLTHIDALDRCMVMSILVTVTLLK